MKLFSRALIIFFFSGALLFSQDNKLLVTGSVSLSSKYYTDLPPHQMYLKRFDYISTSYLSMQADKVKFTAGLNKPAFYYRAGQPDKNYYFEISSPYISSRFGDVNVQFTPNITPYIRIFGFSATASIPSVLEIQAVKGMSRFAVASEGSFLGSYAQELYGGRLSVTLLRIMKFGLSYIKVKDNPSSMDLSASEIPIKSYENLLVGGDMNIYLFSRKLTLGGEYISSFFNSDNSRPGGTLTRYDSRTLKWFGQQNIVQHWMNVNDSTAAGEIYSGKMMLSVLNTSTTIEYKRSSRYAFMLTFPYEQPDQEKLRFNNSSRFLSDKIVLLLNGQYTHTNVSRSAALSTYYLTLNTTLTYDFGLPGKTSFIWRHSDRSNNALPPSGKASDKRIKTIYRTVSLTHSIDFGLWDMPASVMGGVTGNWNINQVRPGSGSEGFLFQVGWQILPPSLFFMNSTVTYGWNQFKYNGARRNSMQIQTREGYQFIPDRLRLYLDQGFFLNNTSNSNEKTLYVNYGAGTGWSFITNGTVELEWQLMTYKDYLYSSLGYLQQSFEIRINYGF